PPSSRRAPAPPPSCRSRGAPATPASPRCTTAPACAASRPAAAPNPSASACPRKSAGRTATPPTPAPPKPASPTTSAPATGSPNCRSGARAATGFGWRFLPGPRSHRLRAATERSGKGGAPDRRLKTLWRRAGAPPFPRERPPEAHSRSPSLLVLHLQYGDRPVLLQHRQPDLVDRRHAVVPHRLLQVVLGQVRLPERVLEHLPVARQDVLLAFDHQRHRFAARGDEADQPVPRQKRERQDQPALKRLVARDHRPLH